MCRGLYGFIFGHRFRSRYHAMPYRDLTNGGTLTRYIYVQDVCCRCGMTTRVKRNQVSPQLRSQIMNQAAAARQEAHVKITSGQPTIPAEQRA
jgi:hypothetical protein